jgi:hypothetical protein
LAQAALMRAAPMIPIKRSLTPPGVETAIFKMTMPARRFRAVQQGRFAI